MVSDNVDQLRKRLDEALERRWKRRNNYGEIHCGPQDIELIEEGIASGANIYSSDEDYAKLDVTEKTARSVLAKAARELASCFPEVDCDELELFLSRCRFQFNCAERRLRKIEHSKDARADLCNLAEKAYDLALAMLSLRAGATEILNQNIIRIGGTDCDGKPIRRAMSVPDWAEFKEEGRLPSEDSSEDELSLFVSSGLIEDAELLNLPWFMPYDSDAWEHDDGLHDYEWSLGGPWIERLRALAELAGKNAEHLKQKTGKGGRKSFGSRLHGSPEDWLAQACKEFSDAQGCNSQAVVLKIVQAVLEAEQGKEAMKKVNGKPSKDKGRKAVRKVAQTKPKSGTV